MPTKAMEKLKVTKSKKAKSHKRKQKKKGEQTSIEPSKEREKEDIVKCSDAENVLEYYSDTASLQKM